MILAWLLLLTGLTISAVAIYYSVIGLTAIFSAAVIPIIIMGSALEIGKLVCASWLKENWERAPRFMKYYMISAVMVLMLITSMGIFGFLSKAHNDQNLVSGDVQSKIAIYDEKIKTAKENIEASRKQLKQMDEAVDQIMGRSQDEKGADKANAVRRSQQRDRSSLAKDIESQQKLIASLNDEAAPIRAEVRKVEAEVGPIKYIAKFIYGDHGADENMLEKAVTWIIILIVIVFDPLAVIMLLAAQMTFGWYREQKERTWIDDQEDELNTSAFVVPHFEEKAEGGNLTTESDQHIVEEAIVTEQEPIKSVDAGEHPADTFEHEHTQPEVPSETPLTALGGDITAPEPQPEQLSELEKWNRMIEQAERQLVEDSKLVQQDETTPVEPIVEDTAVVEESKKKTYMIKDQEGKIQIKNRD